MKDVVECIPYLQQLVEGLNLYGLLEIVRSNSVVFKYVFCKNKLMEWTFDKLDELFVPNYGSDGSTRKSNEINTFKAFMDLLEYSYEEGN